MSVFPTLRVIRHFLKWLVISLFVGSIAIVVLYRWVPVPFTPLMILRTAQQVGRGDTICLKHHWVPLEKMSRYLPVAVMASEDQLFMKHHGFDFDAIGQAMRESREGRRHRGGSTISQQTAKNVFLWPGRSWLRKGLETYFTTLIELCWNKQRIMEVYLNSIEMGPGIYGAEAVAWQHFGCSAAELSRPQCALIAATLPAPLRYSSKRPSNYMLRRQTDIMRQMKHIDLLPPVTASSQYNGGNKK